MENYLVLRPRYIVLLLESLPRRDLKVNASRICVYYRVINVWSSLHSSHLMASLHLKNTRISVSQQNCIGWVGSTENKSNASFIQYCMLCNILAFKTFVFFSSYIHNNTYYFFYLFLSRSKIKSSLCLKMVSFPSLSLLFNSF